MSERRYGDDEVREIFDLATRGRSAETPSPAREGQGLTLAEIQSIGAEVGLSPGDVARAAGALDNRPQVLPRTSSLGLPVAVGRIIPLARALTDDEWARLVAELRATFNARGVVRSDAGIREWSNGNLHAYIEPAGDGHQLRLTTRKGDAAGMNALAFTGIAAGVATFASLGLAGEVADAVLVSSLFTVSGVGAFLFNRLRLPRWADRREEQMDAIARRVKEITGE